MEIKIMGAESRAVALAALYICESILLELEARDILEGRDVQGLLQDAMKTLAAAAETNGPDCLVASEIIRSLREGHKRPGNAPVPI